MMHKGPVLTVGARCSLLWSREEDRVYVLAQGVVMKKMKKHREAQGGCAAF